MIAPGDLNRSDGTARASPLEPAPTAPAIALELAFAARMATREARTTWHLLALLALAIACGSGALVATEAVTSLLHARVDADARAALGGDVDVRGRRPLSPEIRARIESVARSGATTAAIVETLSMASTPAVTATRLVEVRAVGPSYPLYGTLHSDPPGAIERFRRGEGFLVSPALLAQLGTGPGTVLTIGSLSAPIAGTLTGEPDQLAESFRPGPRVLMTLQQLGRAQLIRTGSRATHRIVLALPPGTDAAAAARAIESDPGTHEVEVRTASDGNGPLGRFVRNLSIFLDLVGLAVMLLAGVGAAASVHTLMQHRRTTLAVLRCLGASGRVLVLTYLVQVVALAIAGSAAGALAGLAGERALTSALLGGGVAALDGAGASGAPATPGGVVLAATARGMLVGLLVALGLSLVPLLSARRVSPASLLAPHVAGHATGARMDFAQLAAALGTAGALMLIACSRAGTVEMAALFLVGLAGTGAALMAASRAILLAAGRVPAGGGFAWRHALRRLGRPGHQTGAVLAAVGISVFLVMTVQRVDDLLLRELASGLGPHAPNVFIVDVQEDQTDAVLAALSRHGATGTEAAPLVRSRLAALDGRPIRDLYPDPATAPWFITREYVLTYRDVISDHEAVVEGRLWSAEPPGAEASVERGAAARLGLHLGSTLALDLEGGPVTVTVTSLRTVKWTSLRPNFFIILPPHLLSDRSKTFFAVGHVPDAAGRVALQRELVRAMPNLMVVDVTEGLDLVRRFAARIGLVIALAGALCMLSGMIVLAAAVTLTRAQRAQEGAILKAQGATRPTLLRLMGIEYLLVGLTAGMVGALGAQLLARELVVRLFDLVIDWRWGTILLAAAAAGALTGAAGALASRGVLGKPPLAILREP